MMMKAQKSEPARAKTTLSLQRSGAAIVEMAIIGPVFFFFLIGLVVGGLGVFRYHQVTALACESARWASVHGPNYSRVTGLSKADSEALLKNVIHPRAAGIDVSQLSCELTWSENDSIATVTLRYQWTPEAFWAPVVFKSSAHHFVTY